MLNYNKIHSAINYQRTPKKELSVFMGIANTTLVDRLKKENLTPNDVEKIAEFFGKSIGYFFDKEENEDGVLKKPSKEECKDCIQKEKKIEELERNMFELQTKYIKALEELQGGVEKSKQCG